MEDTLEEALMFMGGLSFGLCMQLDPRTIIFYTGVDKSCGRSDSRSDMMSAGFTCGGGGRGI